MSLAIVYGPQSVSHYIVTSVKCFTFSQGNLVLILTPVWQLFPHTIGNQSSQADATVWPYKYKHTKTSLQQCWVLG